MAGQGLGGGPRASVPGGVRDGANFATCVVFSSFLTRTKRRKIAFFEGCPVGWGGVPPVDGGYSGGKGSGGIQGLRFRKGRCVIFSKVGGLTS